MQRLSIAHLLLATWFLCAAAGTVAAQSRAPRFGAGTEFLVSTADNVGFGFRGRVSMPLNADFSVAIGAGMTGFVLRGRDNANWVFTPQVSAIVTLEGIQKAPYLLAGVGAYVPTGDPSEHRSGPTFHAGIGQVRVLNETSLFMEVDPALVIEKSRIDLSLPVRIGVIF